MVWWIWCVSELLFRLRLYIYMRADVETSAFINNQTKCISGDWLCVFWRVLTFLLPASHDVMQFTVVTQIRKRYYYKNINTIWILVVGGEYERSAAVHGSNTPPAVLTRSFSVRQMTLNHQLWSGGQNCKHCRME